MANINVGLGSVYATMGLSLAAFFYSFPTVKPELIWTYIGCGFLVLIFLSALQFGIMKKDHPHELKKLEKQIELKELEKSKK